MTDALRLTAPPFVVGIALSVVPFELLPFAAMFGLPIYIWYQTSFPATVARSIATLARFAIVLFTLVVAHLLPFKELDQDVDPSDCFIVDDSQRSMLFLSHGKWALDLPAKTSLAMLRLPSETMTFRELIELVEERTRTRAEILNCGSAQTIMFGSYPMSFTFRPHPLTDNGVD